MSRLSNPGLGDVIDRLSVLALKIVHGGEAGHDVSHFEDERLQLLERVHPKEHATQLDLALTLAAVNGAIWQTEDLLRAEQAGSGGQSARWEWVGKLSFLLQRLNDRRAGLVEWIDRDAGDFRGKEKTR